MNHLANPSFPIKHQSSKHGFLLGTSGKNRSFNDVTMAAGLDSKKRLATIVERGSSSKNELKLKQDRAHPILLVGLQHHTRNYVIFTINPFVGLIVHLFNYRSRAPSFRISRLSNPCIPMSREKLPDFYSDEILVGQSIFLG